MLYWTQLFRLSIFPIGAVLGAFMAVLTVVSVAHSAELTDSDLYTCAIESYEKGEYEAAVDNLSLILQEFPDTPLRDMTTFWLARSNLKTGNFDQAATYFDSFCRDYPDSPLNQTAEKELLLALLNRESTAEKFEWIGRLNQDLADQEIRAAKDAAEEFHRLELKQAEENALAKAAADPEERRAAAERKLQQVRDVLRKAETQRQTWKAKDVPDLI